MILNLWDTRGYDEEYERIYGLTYPNTDCFVFLYSIVDRSSYSEILQKWIPEIEHYCPGIPRILLSTKIDLLEDKEIQMKNNENFISTDEGIELQKKFDFEFFIETSSKLHINIDEFLDAIGRTIEKKNLSKKKEKDCIVS